jgi:DNA protecting protein DprA
MPSLTMTTMKKKQGYEHGQSELPFPNPSSTSPISNGSTNPNTHQNNQSQHQQQQVDPDVAVVDEFSVQNKEQEPEQERTVTPTLEAEAVMEADTLANQEMSEFSAAATNQATTKTSGSKSTKAKSGSGSGSPRKTSKKDKSVSTSASHRPGNEEGEGKPLELFSDTDTGVDTDKLPGSYVRNTRIAPSLFDIDIIDAMQQPQLPFQPSPAPLPPLTNHDDNVQDTDEKEFALNLLAVGQIKGIGIQTIKALLKAYPGNSLSLVWGEQEKNLREVIKNYRIKNAEAVLQALRSPSQKKTACASAHEQYAQLQKDGVRLLTPLSKEWPRQLLGIANAPLWLFVQGNPHALREPLIAIVGTRTPSNQALRAASRLAEIVAHEGYGIVSGLAEGIDNLAHKAGLNYRVPQVAVLGTGIDVVYPHTTKRTREELLEHGGVLVSEYLPQTEVSRSQFVERNRIQAALASALVPIEGKLQSGTAHTVNFAEKYQRPLFGVVRTVPNPDNELVELVRQQNCPVFDLDREEEVDRLKGWLRQQLPADIVPAQKYDLNREQVFRAVLSTVDNLLDYVTMSEQDIAWFTEQVQTRYAKARAKTQAKAKKP